jgi:prevent-host-death family protein
MVKLKLSEDIIPLSEFRSNMAATISQLRDTRRPVVLTEHGRSAAVLLGISDYEALLDEVDLLRDIRTAEAQLAAGEGVSNTRAKADLKRRLKS